MARFTKRFRTCFRPKTILAHISALIYENTYIMTCLRSNSKCKLIYTYLFISRFGFKSGICLLIAPVPVHCFSITFIITGSFTVVFS